MTVISKILPENVEILKRENFCILVDHQKDRFDILHPSEAFMLSLLDGNADEEHLIDLVANVYSIDRTASDDMVEGILKNYSSYLIDGVALGNTVMRYDPEYFLFPGFDELSDLTGTLSAPLMITLDLTKKCNFRCRYCYYGRCIALGDDLPLTSALKIIDGAAAAGVVLISLGGAESLLYPDFPQIVQRIKQQRMMLSLTTNGSLLGNNMITQVVASGIQSIGISLDTSDPFIHHYLTRSTDTFDRIVAGIRLLKAKDVWVRTVSVITSHNLNGVAALIDFLMDLGVDAVTLCSYSQRSCTGEPRPFDGSLSRPEKITLSRVVQEKAAQYGDNRVIFDTRETAWQNPKDIRPCSNLLWGLVVHCNGNVFPCELIEDVAFCFGNVLGAATLADVWQGQERRQLLRHTLDRTVIGKECGQCVLLPQCRTGCFNRAKVASGDYFAKDPRCPAGWHNENLRSRISD